MASSKDGSAGTHLGGIYHCEKCGNNFEEYFFVTKKHSGDQSDDKSAALDYTYCATCIRCGTSAPVRQVDLPTRQHTTKQDPADGAVAHSTPQPTEDSDDVLVFPARKISKGKMYPTDTSDSCSSKKQKMKAADVSASSQSSAQTPVNVSPVNSQVDVAKVKSSFFSQTCSCGCSDKSDFSYIADNEDGEILMRVCRQCNDVIGIDDTTPYDEVLRWMEDSEKIRVSLCDCGNENPNRFVFELLGDDIVLKCGQCKKNIPVSTHDDGEVTGSASLPRVSDTMGNCVASEQSESHVLCSNAGPPHNECTCVTRSTSTEAVNDCGCSCDGHPCGRVKIDPSCTWKLNPGDHLTWHRPLGYWHHAIVVRCSSVLDTTVRLIHYAEPTAESTCKGTIVEEWVDLCKQRGDLYRMEYRPRSVYSSDVVIERGRSRLGEVRYNLLDNNCEHFARWCKTGVGKSEQVESLVATLKRIGHKSLVVMGGNTARHLIGRALTAVPSDRPKRWMLQVMPSWKQLSRKVAMTGTAAPSGAIVAKNAGKELAQKQTCCSVVTGALAFTVVMSIEVYSLYHDMKKAVVQHRDGDISDQVFVNIIVKRTCRSIGGVIGATTGTIVPIPVVGTLVGSTLGSLIGEGVGALAGRHTSALVAKRQADKMNGKD